jgi:phage head maturation protease
MDVRGVAVPFDVVAIVDGGTRETLARNAFSAGVGYVVLRFGDHAGRVIARTPNTMRIWPNATGLCFEASLDDADASAFDVIAAGGLGCSINMRIEVADESLVGGVRHCRVRKAILDDIAIVDCPAYSRTAVWPSGVAVDALPSAAVRRLARAWSLGYQSTSRLPATSRGRQS